MEIKHQSVEINRREDIAQLRFAARRIMQDCDTSTREQMRVSWLVDYLARQMLMYGEHGTFELAEVEENDVKGLEIVCNGIWLHHMGNLYQHHIMPMSSEHDDIQFVRGSVPQLKVIAWSK